MSGVDLAPRQMTFAIARGMIDGTIAPLDFEHPILAAALADALIGMRRTLRLSDGTAYHYRATIISLLRDLKGSYPRAISFASADRILVGALHEWESRLATRYTAESAMPTPAMMRLPTTALPPAVPARAPPAPSVERSGIRA